MPHMKGWFCARSGVRGRPLPHRGAVCLASRTGAVHTAARIRMTAQEAMA